MALDWTDEELRAAVDAYLQMLTWDLAGTPYSKAAIIKDLRAGALAARSSLDFRMQNISSVLQEDGLPIVSGYKPQTHVGAAVAQRIRDLVKASSIPILDSYRPQQSADHFERDVARLRKGGSLPRPGGLACPRRSSVTRDIVCRDPRVTAWVLEQAWGTCELCQCPAPFTGRDGFPYLEVHHVRPLGESGSDTPENAAAICPNCHRRCHYASDAADIVTTLYQRVPRLVPE